MEAPDVHHIIRGEIGAQSIPSEKQEKTDNGHERHSDGCAALPRIRDGQCPYYAVVRSDSPAQSARN